jgi:hypothetical protein
VLLLDYISKADQTIAQFCASHEHLKRLKEVYRVVGRHHLTAQKTQQKFRDSTNYALRKRVNFNRDHTIKILHEMIQTFEAFVISNPQEVFNFFDFGSQNSN